MPEPLPRRAVTEVPLAGRVGIDVACRLARAVRRRWRREGRALYQVDCSAVSGFSEPALVELGLLGEELRAGGSILLLANGPWKPPEPWYWPADVEVCPAPSPLVLATKPA
jgi:hypothetical protein